MTPITQVEDQQIEEKSETESQRDTIECPYCKTRNTSGATTCIRCSLPLTRQSSLAGEPSMEKPPESENATRREESPRAVVRFAWGDVVVDGRLGIGRAVDHSPLAPQLGDLRCVSRRHAEIYWEESRVMINDLGSLNHTSVNGRQLTPGEAVELRPGDKLKFSSQVEADVLEIRGRS
ncbi:hypothetical protein JCM15519_21100 [Fundidesulfovibrio butyratiphilus]